VESLLGSLITGRREPCFRGDGTPTRAVVSPDGSGAHQAGEKAAASFFACQLKRAKKGRLSIPERREAKLVWGGGGGGGGCGL